MTGPQSTDVREIQFVSPEASEKLGSLPQGLRLAVNALLRAVQNNQRLPRDRMKDLKDDLAGVTELRQDFDSNTYRLYYVARFKEVLFVLDVEMKKSPKGGDIPKATKQMLRERLKTALRM